MGAVGMASDARAGAIGAIGAPTDAEPTAIAAEGATIGGNRLDEGGANRKLWCDPCGDCGNRHGLRGNRCAD
jgi:hypothetical protein